MNSNNQVINDIMCDEKKINPADLNGDGKVTFMEQVQYTAGQAKAKAEELAAKAKESEAFAKVKDLAAKAGDKAEELAGKVKEEINEAYATTKGQVDDLLAKNEAKPAEPAAPAPEVPAAEEQPQA